MARVLVITFALVVLVATGAAEVVQARRRADPAAAQEVQARLDAIPTEVGAWAGKSIPMNPKMIDRAGAVAYTLRDYTRAKTGETVQVLILAGPPGDIGTHDPERCYGGAGFKPVGSRRRVEVNDAATARTASYWAARFDTETLPAASLQVAWAWTTDGAWAAADDARFEYLGRPVLYKMYVTRRLNPAGPASATDPTAEFLAEFLPAARPALAATTP